MSKDKEKKVEVKVGEGDEAQTISITVKKPGNQLLSRAQRIAAKAWNECVNDGIMTKKELQKYMEKHDIWNKEKEKKENDKVKQITEYEKKLYLKDGKAKKMKLSEARDIAIKMRIARAELRDLIAERLGMESNTAEALSDNTRFDFLVANCTFDENGQNKVYNSLDDYLEKSDDDVAFAAATALAELMYSIDKDVEANLPENRFLSKFKYVNDDLSLVDKEGHRVDSKGRRVDDDGYYINDENQRVDLEGNLLDEEGNYIPSVTYTDDSGKIIKPDG
jgi:hypothetical protein